MSASVHAGRDARKVDNAATRAHDQPMRSAMSIGSATTSGVLGKAWRPPLERLGPPLPERPLSRNQGIDLLPGLSILLVVVHHISLHVPLRNTALATFVPNRMLDALIYNGPDAVFVFFVSPGS